MKGDLISEWKNPFEDHGEDYDRWFESDKGRLIFSRECDGLKHVIGDPVGKWLEVGVGSGRFALAMGIGYGVEPSSAMARIAASRGILTCRAMGEMLPFKDETFDGLLMVCTLCFLRDPGQTLRECGRILKTRGRLVAAFVPADSLWGMYHAERGQKGHAYYRYARFYTPDEVKTMAEETGFTFHEKKACPLPPPDGEPNVGKSTISGPCEEGFVVLSFKKTN